MIQHIKIGRTCQFRSRSKDVPSVSILMLKVNDNIILKEYLADLFEIFGRFNPNLAIVTVHCSSSARISIYRTGLSLFAFLVFLGRRWIDPGNSPSFTKVISHKFCDELSLLF